MDFNIRYQDFLQENTSFAFYAKDVFDSDHLAPNANEGGASTYRGHQVGIKLSSQFLIGYTIIKNCTNIEFH